MRIVKIVRNVEFDRLFDAFFVSAITTILVTRFYLQVTGYPQIGNSAMHISHLLPGSLLLLAALLLLLSAVNRAARDFSAILGGIGFGLVWDEIGKFVTQDNNYFFKAAPGLIYLTFVLLYLVARFSAQKRFSADDYLANVLDLLKDAAIKDLDEREYEHAKELMTHVPPEHPLYAPTLEILKKVKPSKNQEPLLVDRLINLLMSPIKRVSKWPHFRRLVIIISVLYGVVSIFTALFFFYGALANDVIHLAILQGDESDIVGSISALLAAIYVTVGLFYYAHGKIHKAYRFFEISLLINIFVGQAVLFFKNAWIAMIGLVVTLVLLFSVKILIEEDFHHRVRRKKIEALPV